MADDKEGNHVAADVDAEDTTAPTDNEYLATLTEDSAFVDSQGEKDYRIDIIKDQDTAMRAKRCLLHTTAKPGRHARDLAKTPAKRHVHSVSTREVKGFGVLMSMDHVERDG